MSIKPGELQLQTNKALDKGQITSYIDETETMVRLAKAAFGDGSQQHLESLLVLGQSLRVGGQHDRAIAVYHQVLAAAQDLDPNSESVTECYSALADCFRALEQREGAGEFLKKSREIDLTKEAKHRRERPNQ